MNLKNFTNRLNITTFWNYLEVKIQVGTNLKLLFIIRIHIYITFILNN